MKILSGKVTPNSNHDAGYDIHSSESTVIKAGSRGVVKTNLKVEIPEGTYGMLASRSGLAFKFGITAFGGIIDSNYRGEIGVLLFNHSDVDFEVKKGMKVCQMILNVFTKPSVEYVDKLSETDRGAKGFGSTGLWYLIREWNT